MYDCHFFWRTEKENRKENGYEVVVLPAFDIVHSFPFPMFWMPSFWSGLYKAKKWLPDIIHTHTRFFLSSFLGGILQKLFKSHGFTSNMGVDLLFQEVRLLSK